MEAVRQERAAAARAIEESAAVRRFLGRLGTLAERDGHDPVRRLEIIRTATKAITFHARRGRLHIRYAFGAPAHADSCGGVTNCRDFRTLVQRRTRAAARPLHVGQTEPAC